MPRAACVTAQGQGAHRGLCRLGRGRGLGLGRGRGKWSWYRPSEEEERPSKGAASQEQLPGRNAAALEALHR